MASKKYYVDMDKEGSPQVQTQFETKAPEFDGHETRSLVERFVQLAGVIKSYLFKSDIDTIAKLNSILTDATLIDDAPSDGSPYVRQDGAWVNENVFGTEFQQEEDDVESVTTSTTYQQKFRMTTPSLPSGTYRIGFYYSWSGQFAGYDAGIRVQVNDTDTIHEQNQGAEAAGTVGIQTESGFDYYTGSGVLDIDVDFRSQASFAAVWLREVRLEIWRVA